MGGSLPPRTAQQSPISKAHTHFSYQASGIGESSSSGSQLLACLLYLSTPRYFYISPGKGVPHPCHLNLKLHKRKPFQSVLPSTSSALDTPESPPKYQEPSRSYLPLTWAPLAAASSERRPPRTSSGQEPIKGETSSSRNLFGRLQQATQRRASGLFPGLCPTPTLPGPFPELPRTPVPSLSRRLGRLSPSLTDVPGSQTSPHSASPGASRSSAAGLRH